MPDIFVSYSSEDRRRVGPFVEELRERGWDVWWDQQIAPGHKFDDTIERVIRDSRCVLVFWSKFSVGSEWVKNEAMVGLERGTLVPVMLDRVELPLAFRRVQAADLTRWSRMDAAQRDNLLGYIDNVVERGETGGESPPLYGHGHAKAPPPAPRWRKPFAVVGLLAGLLVVALVGTQLIHDELTGEPDYREVIAVLPFQVFSSVPENRFFAAGIHDEILSKLARVNGLAVIARTSVMQYSDTDWSIKEIARQLDADLVMEGTVRFDRDRVRVSTQLIDSEDESHIWAEVFEVELEDIFEVQSTVATRVAEVVTGKKVAATELGGASTRNADAYAEFLLARHFVIRSQPGSALEHLDRAIELDPGFAAAYAERSRYYYLAMTSYNLPPQEAVPRYLENLQKAYELNPDDPDVIGTMALAKLREGKLEEGAELRDRLLRRAPNNSRTYMSLASWPVPTAERIELLRRAVALDPLNGSTRYRLVMALLQARSYEEALEQARFVDDLEPNTFNRARMAEALDYLGRRDESQVVYAQVIAMLEEQLANVDDLGLEQTTTESLLAVVLARSGDREAAQAVVDQLEAKAAQGLVNASNMVLVYGATQDVENITRWMQRLISELGYWFPRRFLVEHPYYDFLRGTDEYQELLELTSHLP